MAAVPQLVITFWDVGQGDCSTIELPDGRIIILDTGPMGSPLVDWLRQRQRRVHAVVITHNDADHVGALPSILAPGVAAIDNVFWLADRPQNKQPYGKLLRLVNKGFQERRFGVTRLEVGAVIYENQSLGIKIHVVHPRMMENELATKPNLTSGIICLDRNGKTELIWPGDSTLDQVAEKCGRPKPYIMVGPHHGAPEGWRLRANTTTKLSQIAASRAYISVGTKNKYSHPRPKYLRILESVGTQVCCSEITYFCDRHQVLAKIPVIQTHALLGLKPPRSGVACRGPLQIHLTAGGWETDGWDTEHQKRISTLRRPQCLLGRRSAKSILP